MYYPGLADVLLSIKSCLIAIILIGIAKLTFVAVRWNYKNLERFTRKYKIDSFNTSIIRAQRIRMDRKRRILDNPKTKTDSSNFLAIITMPFTSIFNAIRSLFR